MASPPSEKPYAVPPPFPNWLELPDDVSVSIFRRLDPVEILTRAQHVCSTWRRICRDPSVWTCITINCHADEFGMNKRNLTKLYKRAVDLSCRDLLGATLIYASEGLLRYVTRRSDDLRCLRLVYCDDISDTALMMAVGRIQFLEVLDLSYCYFSSQTIAQIGRLSPELESFKLNARPWKQLNARGCKRSKNDREALAIAKNMPGLHHLQMFGNKLTNAGLVAILDGCKQLESLDLRQCFHVSLGADLKRRCTEQIKHFRGPNDSTDDYPFVSDDDGSSDVDDWHASSDASEDGEVNGGLSDDEDGHASSDAGFSSDCEDGEVNGGLSEDDDWHASSDAGFSSDGED